MVRLKKCSNLVECDDFTTTAKLHVHNLVDLLCGTTTAKLHVHNLVDLLCGTTAAETFERFSKHRSIVDFQQTLEICALYEG